MPEDLIKNEKDRVLVNHALSDIYSGLKVPADTMKYLEEKYPSIFAKSLDTSIPKKKKIKVNPKKIAITVAIALTAVSSITALANSEKVVRDREISKAHEYFNTVIAPELISEGNITEEELVSKYFDLQHLTSEELGISDDCAAYALLDYYDSIDLDDELYASLGYSDKADFAVARDYVPNTSNVTIDDELVAASSFDNMNEEEFLNAVNNQMNLNQTNVVEGERNGR